jgi:ABC-type transport system involved in multi-copper enzyme maturation permease subunit
MRTIRTLIRKELRDAKTNKWLYFYAGIIAVLGAVIALTGLQQGGALALQVFGRTTATLINLCLFLAPLVALTLGSGCITGEKDQGTLEQLLAQPITFTELLLGKYLGLWIALFMATLVGFAPAGIIIGWVAPMSALRFLIYPLLSQLLISVMLSIGLLISVTAKSRAQSQTIAIAIWFVTVLAYDIVFLGSLAIISLSANTLAMTLFINPVDAARVFAVLTLEPDMYILGPSGAYMIDTFSALGAGAILISSLLIWTVLPFIAAAKLFTTRLLFPSKRRSYFRFALRAIGMLTLAFVIASCGDKKGDSEPAEDAKEETSGMPAEDDYHADVANLAHGTELYMTNCSPCHGKAGKGDGPAAANLNPKPRDHSNGEYMGKLTDKHIGSVIKKGGGIAGYPTMPAHPHLKTEDINAVIAFVRTLGKKT